VQTGKVNVDIEEIGRQVVDSAVKMQRALGSGLLESAYQACIAYELRKKGCSPYMMRKY
jgi:GxxExxY protein